MKTVGAKLLAAAVYCSRHGQLALGEAPVFGPPSLDNVPFTADEGNVCLFQNWKSINNFAANEGDIQQYKKSFFFF